MCIVTEIDLTQGHKNISSILEILQINCDLSKNNKILQKKGGRSFLESVQMTKHETITWRRWWSCSPWTSWPPSPQRRPGLEQAEMKIYWGLKSFWPNRCLLLGKPSCKKKCFLSGIARIKKYTLYIPLWRSKKDVQVARKKVRGGGGNLGNARKKTFFFPGGVP